MAHIEYSPSNDKTDEAQGVGLGSKEPRFESGGDAMVHLKKNWLPSQCTQNWLFKIGYNKNGTISIKVYI